MGRRVAVKHFPVGAAEWAATITSIALFLINIAAVNDISRLEHIILAAMSMATAGVAIMWRRYQWKDLTLHILWLGVLFLYGVGSAFL
jgi:hypothetical protein